MTKWMRANQAPISAFCWKSFAFVSSFVLLNLMPCQALSENLPPVPERIVRIDFAHADHQFRIDILPDADADVTEGNLYCANPSQSPELRGRFTLLLSEAVRDLSRVDLGDSHFVENQGHWEVNDENPLRLLLREPSPPLIAFRQYGGCNGHTYRFFTLVSKAGPPQLQALSFSRCGGEQDAIYASHDEKSIKLIKTDRPYGYELWAKGYSQMMGHIIYQYGEDDPGHWICLGFYSEAGGGYQAPNNKFFTNHRCCA